ncbi:MAG TPA: hypothetical protein V6D28_13340 [Leptolyngbyaceae cyanobacterium]
MRRKILQIFPPATCPRAKTVNVAVFNIVYANDRYKYYVGAGLAKKVKIPTNKTEVKARPYLASIAQPT